MRPLKRQMVSKSTSAKQFRKKAGRTKAPNIMSGPMRGGIRL